MSTDSTEPSLPKSKRQKVNAEKDSASEDATVFVSPSAGVTDVSSHCDGASVSVASSSEDPGASSVKEDALSSSVSCKPQISTDRQPRTPNSAADDDSRSSTLTKDKNAEGVLPLATPPAIQWPWIPLRDPKSGKTYYYNALTSETAWSVGEEPPTHLEGSTSTTSLPPDPSGAAGTSESLPPTSYAAARAQKAWQQYWVQFQNGQTELPSGGTASAPVATFSESEAAPASDTARKTTAPSLAIFVEHYVTPTAQQLGRPARQQVRPPSTEAGGYVQGFEEYNIWYGKYLSDRFEGGGRRDDREKASTRCNPFTDSGWTRCDLEPEMDRPIICLYFAKGCCYLGSKCRYYHRLPTVEDNDKLDMLHDIFGRERYASHRDDMDGVGTFSEDCRTLFVGDLKVNRVFPNAEGKTEELLRQQFGLWGPLEDIRVIRHRNIAFVRYKYRVHAEFAKVAMAEQRILLDREDDQISVRWAHPGRSTHSSDGKPSEYDAREWEAAHRAVMKRLQTLGYTQDDIDCYLRWEIHNASGSSTTTHDTTHPVPPPESRDVSTLSMETSTKIIPSGAGTGISDFQPLQPSASLILPPSSVTDVYPNTDTRLAEGIAESQRSLQAHGLSPVVGQPTPAAMPAFATHLPHGHQTQKTAFFGPSTAANSQQLPTGKPILPLHIPVSVENIQAAMNQAQGLNRIEKALSRVGGYANASSDAFTVDL